ncbi:MAG: twin-arginine translocation signal domain-containing protein [Pirellulales bacterium]|nr:twin-arginine translocation signal domain-containing protein [Pirellulales bacterium]
MSKIQKLNRRSLLKAAGTVTGAALVGAAAPASPKVEAAEKPELEFDNSALYDAQGKFDVDKGKDAVLALCKYHGYPVFPGLRENLWVSDYNTGLFTSLGLAAYMFINNEADRYMLMDLFLLPGQMLPEHWHLDGETNPAKREGWLVRWGASHIVGIGEPNLSKDIVIPQCHMGGKVTTEHEVYATPGVFVPLAKVKTRHWQYGGPEGAILTEVANVHTNSAVRHSDPQLNKHFLGE